MALNRNRIAAIFAGAVMGALLSGAPARADDDMLYGQPAPKQFLLNKMFSPKSLGLNDPSSSGANDQAAGGANGQAARPQDDEEDGAGPYPKRYLLNRMFEMGK